MIILPRKNVTTYILQNNKIRAEEARKAALEGLFKTLLHHLMTAKIRLPMAFITHFYKCRGRSS